MLQCLNDPSAMSGMCDIAARCADVVLDVCQGIARAGDHPGVAGIEHGQIIVTVADGKASGRVQRIVPGHLTEAAAFLKIAVAEAQIDRVALPTQQGLGTGPSS